ncbi:MAG: hypothetical protein IEMM0008_0200 [bacterium]|nr:MAG: hypothetical protein IEMM0008_0200 [bacterium]
MNIDPSKSQKSFGSRIKQFFQMNRDGEKADRAMRHAFITSIFVTLITGILLVSSHLMQSGIETAIHKYENVGYTLLLKSGIGPGDIVKNFAPWYYLVFLLSLVLTFGIYKKSRVAVILMFLVFLGDKALLLSHGVLNIGTGLPIILPVIFLLFQGIRGTFCFHSIGQPTSSETKGAKANKKLLFLDSTILLLIVMLASVIVHQILRWVEGTEVITSLVYWLEGKGLAIDSWRYPVGILIVGLVCVIPLYSYFKKLIGTFQLAVMIVLFIALATFTATNLLPQSGTTPFVFENNPEYFTEAYGIYLARAMLFLELDNIFLSIWYCSLYVVLIASLVKVIKKKKFGLKNTGFHLLHISLIVIIGAAWFNYPFSIAGYINLWVGGGADHIIVHYPHSLKKFVSRKTQKKLKKKMLRNDRYLPAEKLGFYIRLDRFVTKNWDADYKIYVRKFPKKLPKKIPAGTFQTMKRVVNQLVRHLSDNLNPDDQRIKRRVLSVRKALTETYRLEEKVVTRPVLSLLSTVGLNFLATQSYDLEIESRVSQSKMPTRRIYLGKHYLLNRSKLNDRVKEDLAWFFRYFRYKGKDIASHPILSDPDKRKKVYIFTTDVTYSIKDYIPDYDYLLVPKRIDKKSFEKKILSHITDIKKREVIETIYHLGKDSYTLSQELNQPASQQILARVLETIDQKALHSSVKAYNPMAHFILKEDNKNS